MQTRKWSKYFAAVAMTATLAAASAGAQSVTPSDVGRKAKTKSAPVYPELARRMGVTGRVKLEIVITPDGRVKSTRVIGGHPILVQACQDAIKDWKYASAPEETTQVVEFEFHEQ
jgi:TonB family protein